MRTRGWWRRNVWGLLLILPLTAALFYQNADGLYDRNYRLLPMEPVAIDGTGRAVLDEYAIRVIEVKPLRTEAELKHVTVFGRPRPPSSVTVWRSILSVDAPADSGVSSCDVFLEDGSGRTYKMGPSDLSGDSIPFAVCGPDDEKQPVPYTATTYFLLPAEATPAALLVTWHDRLPRYIRFAIP
jgi:hypothetical protein